MIRRPPRSTLFPTRRSSDLVRRRADLIRLFQCGAWHGGCRWSARAGGSRRSAARLGHLRSEEHTSELQSLAYLVCRLLLEKKKKQTTTMPKILLWIAIQMPV